MKQSLIRSLWLTMLILAWGTLAMAASPDAEMKIETPDIAQKDNSARFEKGASEFGVQAGLGYSLQLPPGVHRTNWNFAFFAPNYKYNLTGVVGESFYRGTLSWMTEADIVTAYSPSSAYLLGVSPLMFEYKFLQPDAKFIPYAFVGAGFSGTNWDRKPYQNELGTDFEFLLHAGVGVEFCKTKYGAFSANYRFFHVSNAGIRFPNIGVNAGLATLGYAFY